MMLSRRNLGRLLTVDFRVMERRLLIDRFQRGDMAKPTFRQPTGCRHSSNATNYYLVRLYLGSP